MSSSAIGPFTLQKHATRAARAGQRSFPRSPALFMAAALLVAAATLVATRVNVSGRALLVDGEPFLVRGGVRLFFREELRTLTAAK